MRLNYKWADLVIYIGDAAQEAAIKTFSIRPEKTVVVRPGISGRLAESNPGELRRELNIGADEKVVLSVGRITKAKGVERNENYGNAIRQKYGEFVTFIGRRSDIANVYADTDLLVHLSHREGSPLVVIEALESGVPCVAWGIPGTSEDVEDGITGRRVPFGDHVAAAHAIEQIFEQPGLLEKFGEGA